MINVGPFFVNELESIWFVINCIGVGFAIGSLVDALADRAAILALNGRARGIVGNGNVRREVIRLVVQLLLLSAVIPGLFIDRPTPLTPAVVALMAVPFLIVANSILDAQERRRLAAVLETDLANERRQKLRETA